jgi:hypothetical protein
VLAALSLLLGALPASCPPGAFLTYEHGVLAGVNWVRWEGPRLDTRSWVAQSRILEATVEVRPDWTTVRSTATLSEPGGTPAPPRVQEPGTEAISWSDMIPSSIEQAVLRARATGARTVRIAIASLYSGYRSQLEAERLGERDWRLLYRGKAYDVLTDERGCVVAASLPAYGVVIERRTAFPAEAYPLWAAHGPPPDGAYRAEEVAIRAPQGHVLAGTLTTPRDLSRRCPGAVLITGLSAHERNNGEPPWMPFRDIADALTRAGLCVLRVDDRGVAASTGDRASSTTFDEANDVRTEVAWLRGRPDVDGRRILLVGYSEGGLIAPMVASADPDIAGIVTLAGPGVSGPELARYQIEAAVRGDPSVPEERRAAEVEKQLGEPLTPRERSFLSIDPLRYAAQVHCPALILQGGADLTVPPRSAQRLAAAMRDGGNPDVTVRLFPGISHSLLPDPQGLSSGWPFLPAFLTAPEVLATLSRWAAEHLHP